MEHYAVMIVADADKADANKLIAYIEGETPDSENISRPASPTGDWNDPITHWYGGRPVTQAWLDIYQDLPAKVATMTWPWVHGGNTVLTQEQAETVAPLIDLTVRTRETYTSQMAQDVLDAALAPLGIVRMSED